MGLEDPTHEDFRGIINRHQLDGFRFNVLTTKKGGLRSGDVHPHPQYDLVLKGEFEVTMKIDGRDVVKVYGPNEFIVIPPKVPHLFRALTDTVMIEYWEGGGLPVVEYYQPYRKLIEEQFKSGKLN